MEYNTLQTLAERGEQIVSRTDATASFTKGAQGAYEPTNETAKQMVAAITDGVAVTPGQVSLVIDEVAHGPYAKGVQFV